MPIFLSSPNDIEDAYEVGYGGPGYYFWDETSAYLVGPYTKETTAIESRERYFKELSKEHIPYWNQDDHRREEG